MSSFKRAAPKSAASSMGASSSSGLDASVPAKLVTGVKPWVQTGLGLVSTGNKQLDELIGGGTTLGTITLIESDIFSNYGETFALYELAEAISHQHSALLIAEDRADAERILGAVPYNQTVSTYDSMEVGIVDTQAAVGKLSIAWQYAKYMKPTENKPNVRRERTDGSDQPPVTYCCSYDLSRRLQPGLFTRGTIELCLADTISGSSGDTSKGRFGLDAALGRLALAVRDFITSQQRIFEKQVCRIVIAGLDQVLASIAADCGCAVSGRDVARFLLRLKHTIQDVRASVLVTVNSAAVGVETAVRLRQMADTVLSVESFAGRTQSVPYEFKEFQGFFVVHKIQHYGSMAPFRPPGTRFGLKRDRRKLHIEPLHLPPEESRAFSTTGGAAPAHTSGADALGQAHVHSEHCNHGAEPHSVSVGASGAGVGPDSAASRTSGSSTHAAAESAPVYRTPLQASLAALKAARQAAQGTPTSAPTASTSTNSTSSGSTDSAGSQPAFAPVSIHRARAPAATAAGSRTTVLQPGQACGAGSPGQAGASNLDF